jgi:adenosine/AMP kinase
MNSWIHASWIYIRHSWPIDVSNSLRAHCETLLSK